MKLNKLWLWLTGLILTPYLALAEEVSTNASALTTNNDALPTTVSDYWTYGISVVTPLIVLGVKKVIPKIPTWLLPTITPFLGILLGLALNKLGASHLGWVDMAKAGALAVFIREVVNQTITQNLSKSKGAA